MFIIEEAKNIIRPRTEAAEQIPTCWSEKNFLTNKRSVEKREIRQKLVIPEKIKNLKNFEFVFRLKVIFLVELWNLFKENSQKII